MTTKLQKAEFATINAESQYSWMCRTFEYLKNPRFKKLVTESPLYLWTDEKYKQAIQYYNDGNIDFTKKLKYPITMVNPECGMTIMSFELKDETSIYEMVSTSWVPKTDNKILACVHSVLQITPTEDPKFNASFNIVQGELCVIEDKKIIESEKLKESSYADVAKSSIKIYALAALFKHHYIYRPKQVVVKEVPKKVAFVKDHNGKSKVPRLHQREIHYLLDPDEILQIRKEAEEIEESKINTGVTRAFRGRKAHTRTFRDKRFTKMRGQSIIVKDADVKKGDVIKAKKIYHVVSVGGLK